MAMLNFFFGSATGGVVAAAGSDVRIELDLEKDRLGKLCCSDLKAFTKGRTRSPKVATRNDNMALTMLNFLFVDKYFHFLGI